MTTDELGPLKQAFERMTDDELDAWLAAGSFESVQGVPLPPEATAKVAALVGGAEVEGFTLNFNPIGGFQLPPLDGTDTADSKNTKGGALFKHCCQGVHFKEAKLT